MGGLTIEELESIVDEISAFLANTQIVGDEYDIEPEVFAEISMTKIKEGLFSYNNNSTLSQEGKDIVMKEVKLFYLENLFFNYTGLIKQIYEEQKADNGHNMIALNVEEPSKSYYYFLKEFDLNNPDYISSTYYPNVLQYILKNEVFGISPIGETKVSDWIDDVQESMKDILGSNSGLVYDMLAATSYAVQLNAMSPLSETQKRNIEDYFTNDAFTKTLLGENVMVLEVMEYDTKAKGYTINETQKVDKSDVMKTIISEYKGKVVFVGFWATWCIPCLQAMKEADPVKVKFRSEEVAFVYITDVSSPRKAWEHQISEIRGEHYYLEQEEWDYILDFYGFSGLPTYLVFDSEGELRRNHTTFMGQEKMQEWIEELIPR